jgi:hypothetical protein
LAVVLEVVVALVVITEELAESLAVGEVEEVLVEMGG